MSSSQWYVAQTRPRQEQRAELNLRNQGFETYTPFWRVEKVYQSKRVERREPLFPGYLFIRLCPNVDDFRPIRSTRGVLRLVGFGGQPTPVGSDVVECIRRRAGDIDPRPAINAGERVEITEGPFRGLEAIFQSFDGDERVVLLLNFMQQQVRSVQPVASIRRA